MTRYTVHSIVYTWNRTSLLKN